MIVPAEVIDLDARRRLKADQQAGVDSFEKGFIRVGRLLADVADTVSLHMKPIGDQEMTRAIVRFVLRRGLRDLRRQFRAEWKQAGHPPERLAAWWSRAADIVRQAFTATLIELEIDAEKNAAAGA